MNHNKVTGGIPDSLLAILGPGVTNSQGKFDVSEQFQYASAIADTKRAAIYFRTFDIVVATLAYVVELASNMIRFPGGRIYRRGFIGDPSKIEIVPG